MLTKIMTLILELCLASATTATVLRRYGNYPVPDCPSEAVCSEIYSLSAFNLPPAFLNTATCKCPAGSYCPTEPGPQTLSVDVDKWYGLCGDVAELPRCERGEIAEEIYVNSLGFGGKNFTKIHCTCSGHELGGVSGDRAATVWAGSSTDNSNAKVVHHLICNDEYMTKRGRFGESSRGRNRGRFYFYRK